MHGETANWDPCAGRAFEEERGMGRRVTVKSSGTKITINPRNKLLVTSPFSLFLDCRLCPLPAGVGASDCFLSTEILRLVQNGKRLRFLKMHWGGGGFKSMAQIVKNSQRKKKLCCLLPTSEQSPPRPNSNSLPWGHIEPAFPPADLLSQEVPSPSLATASVHHPLSSRPFWAGGLVTFFSTFPGPCCTISALQAEDIFPKKPGGKLNSFF